MALPPLTDCGRTAGQRYPGERNHQRRSDAASLADAVGAGNRNPGDISGRTRATVRAIGG